MDLQTFLFYVLALMTGASAVAVVVTQNIVRAAAWLLFTLAGTAGIFFLLGADFVGGTQLIVYVGGILVLVVFGVMLTAQGPFITMKTGAAEWAVSTVVGLSLYAVLAVSITLAAWPSRAPDNALVPDPARPEATSMSTTVLGEALLGIKEATPKAELPAGGSIFLARYRVGYLLPFEIVSIHLLVVLIGAAYLARAKRRRPGAVP